MTNDSGSRFWRPLPGTLLLLDLGFTNYTYYVRLMALQVTFITRCKSNAAYQIKQVLHKALICMTHWFCWAKTMPLRLG
ncbi:MAG: hypothetical protein R3A44_25595 [Caldilineaceae bacterium]